jgi:hypothetical protein
MSASEVMNVMLPSFRLEDTSPHRITPVLTNGRYSCSGTLKMSPNTTPMVAI